MRKQAAYVALVLGLSLGVALSVYVPRVDASRNSGGTYSLPSGNPVVTGTPISSTVHNATMADVAAEITNSLDRGGRGAMTAPLQCSNGTVGAPSLTFASDTDTGFYRIGANNIGITLGATKYGDMTTSTFAWTGAITAAASATNGTGVTSTGNGTGAGVTGTGGATGAGVTGTGGATSGRGGLFQGVAASCGARGTGGATSGNGLEGIGGAPNGHGGVFEGDGTGEGIRATGGDSDGDGVYGLGGTSNGNGGVFDGSGTGSGIVVGTGHVRLNGSNPASTTGFTNKLTPTNIPKAWALVQSSSSAVTVLGGFNVANPAASGGNCWTVDLVDDLTDTNAVILASLYDQSQAITLVPSFVSVGQVKMCAVNVSDAALDLTSASPAKISILVFGAQ